MTKEIKSRKGLFKEIQKRDTVVHMVLIGTKPDIIKQAPLIAELKKAGEYVLVIHSGQHYDWNLSGGLEEEFNIRPDINLGVAGPLYEQQSQIIQRLGSIMAKIRQMGKRAIPYIYGDTTTAVAAGVASFTNLVSTAHVEAGLRTMSPARDLLLGLLGGFEVEEYLDELRQSGNWQKGSYEPYPEQFDTRAAAPSVGVHFVPTRLNAEHILHEGSARERVFVVGNPIVDALEFALERVASTKIFEKFPTLEEGSVIRFCVHRRENISSYHRFKAIYDAMVALIKEGRTVLLISLGATEKALKSYNLKERTDRLAKRYKNFVYSPVWPFYTDVVAVMLKCSVVVTDSGSIQEETATLGVPGVVLRFNTDRPEAIFEGANIIAPPIKSGIILKIIREVADNDGLRQKMRGPFRIYGNNVSQRMVRIVQKAVQKNSLFNLFELMEQDRLGLKGMSFWEQGGTSW